MQSCCPVWPQYPHYTFVDKDRMYTVGSLFYAIYFFASFPMFFRMDEDAGSKKFTASEAAFDRWVVSWRDTASHAPVMHLHMV